MSLLIIHIKCICSSTQAINKLVGVFTLTDELLLTSVAIQSSNVLRRARLYEEEVRSKRRNVALLQVCVYFLDYLDLLLIDSVLRLDCCIFEMYSYVFMIYQFIG